LEQLFQSRLALVEASRVAAEIRLLVHIPRMLAAAVTAAQQLLVVVGA
jgi:uncharacterized membrane protein